MLSETASSRGILPYHELAEKGGVHVPILDIARAVLNQTSSPQRPMKRASNAATSMISGVYKSGSSASINYYSHLAAYPRVNAAETSVIANATINETTRRFLIFLQNYAHLLSDRKVCSFRLQLISLLLDEAELPDEHTAPSFHSFAGLLQFCIDYPRLHHPNLSLTRSGEFVASWAPNPQKKIALTFYDLRSGKWAAVDRAANHRQSGRLDAASSIRLIRHYRMWMEL